MGRPSEREKRELTQGGDEKKDTIIKVCVE